MATARSHRNAIGCVGEVTMELRDATAVVTGGGAGIGEALARRFAADGARMVVGDLDADAAARVVDDVGGVGVARDAASEHGIAT